MSINKLISINTAIIDALEMFGTDRSVTMPTLMMWAVEAEKEIGHSSHILPRHKKIIDVHGCKAELPCNCEVLEYAVVGAQNCDCNDLRDNFYGVITNNTINTSGNGTAVLDGTGFLVVDVTDFDNGTFNCLDYEIQNNCMIFRRKPGNSVITIQYLGHPLDEEGFPLVSENHIRAIRQYIVWRYMERSKFSSNKMSSQDTELAKQEWGRLCRHARADDAILSPSENSEIGNMLSNNPYSGKGLWVGMRTANWFNYM